MSLGHKTTLCDRSATLLISLKDIRRFYSNSLIDTFAINRCFAASLFSRRISISKNIFVSRRYIKLLAFFRYRAGAVQRNTALPGPLEHLPSQRQVPFAFFWIFFPARIPHSSGLPFGCQEAIVQRT